MNKLWKWIEHNRFAVIAPIIMLAVWLYAVGCTPTTASPLNPNKQVTTAELELDLQSWLAQNEIIGKRFEYAAQDIERQKQAWAEVQAVIMKLATGSVADLPGLLQMVMGGTFIGVLADRARASGVIGKQKAIIKKNGGTA